MSAAPRFARIAIPSPLPRHFDYRLIAGDPVPAPGTRVRVPFGRQELVGVVLGVTTQSDLPRAKLKPIRRSLDSEPLLPATLMELLVWASAYYPHPIGEVMATALPVMLRRGLPATAAGEKRYVLTEAARRLPPDALKRSPLQQRLVQVLREHAEGLSAARLAEVVKNWRDAMNRLTARGLIRITEEQCLPPRLAGQHIAPQLTAAQEQAGGGRHAFGPERQRTSVRLANGAHRTGRGGDRYALGSVYADAETGAGYYRRGARRVIQAAG